MRYSITGETLYTSSQNIVLITTVAEIYTTTELLLQTIPIGSESSAVVRIYSSYSTR